MVFLWIRIKVVVFFMYSLACYFLFPNATSKFYFSGKSLLGKSFRIPRKDDQSLFFFLVVLKKIFFISKSQNQLEFFENSNDAHSIIFDADIHAVNTRLSYIQHFTQITPKGLLAKEHLSALKVHKAQLIGDFLQVCFLWPWLFVLAVIKKNKRAIMAQIILESIECVRLLSFCRKNTIQKIFYFSIYDKDSNITALLLQKQGIYVYKIPSEVPLGIWNQTIITDTLCICNAYQYDELKVFKKSLFYHNIEKWGPELMLQHAHIYVHNKVQTPKNTIGFYSTASWVRELQGHIDQGVQMEKNEHLVKQFLSEYLTLHPDITLYLFLHPKEKKYEMSTLTQNHYAKYFDMQKVTIANLQHPTASLFSMIDLAVAFNSTIIFERLYFGFKCLMLPLFNPNFPLKNTSMENICAINKEDFFHKLDKNLAYSTQEYFDQNMLQNYPYYASI